MAVPAWAKHHCHRGWAGASMPQDMGSGRNESFCPFTTVGTLWNCPLMQETCTLHRSSACWALLFAEVVVAVLLASSQRSADDSRSSLQNRFQFPARRSHKAAKVFQTAVALACELSLAGPESSQRSLVKACERALSGGSACALGHFEGASDRAWGMWSPKGVSLDEAAEYQHKCRPSQP